MTSPFGSEAQQRWLALAASRAADLSLLEGTFLIARDEYPQLLVGEYVSLLERIAAEARAQLAPAADETDKLDVLNAVLFDQWGFSGNRDDYYDPRNSYVNEVLDRRLGIPISLAVLYLEISGRIGLEAHGVGFPGHFLVRVQILGEESRIIDPFNSGAQVQQANLKKQLADQDSAEGGAIKQFLEPASSRSILVRMLRNLKAIYLSQQDAQRSLRTCDRIVALLPGDASEYRDRALLYQELEVYHAAMEDFQHYLELAPQAADATLIRGRIAEIRSRVRPLH